MNIFVLDDDPVIAAKLHCDKHVVKMILESAQLLSTAHRLIDGVPYDGSSRSGRKAKRWQLPDNRDSVLYQATHINHPCAVWCRETSENYKWLYRMFIGLTDEYSFRYGKTHKCVDMTTQLNAVPNSIRIANLTEFPQAMPDECKTKNAADAYKNYYIIHKKRFAVWTKREVPEWFLKSNITK